MRRLRAWARVPGILVRFPAILASILGAGLILAVASGASSLFLSSAGSAAIQGDVARTGPGVPAFTLVDYSSPEADLMAYRDHLLVPRLVRAGLARPVRSILGTQLQVSLPGSSDSATVVPITRDGAVQHVTATRRASGDGLWVARSVATALKLDPGDTLTVGSGRNASRIRVAGIYRDLADQPRSTYWAPLSAMIYRSREDPDLAPPPPFLVMSQPAFVALEQRLGDQGQFRWEFQVQTASLTLGSAGRLASVIERVQGDVGDASTKLGAAFPGTSYTSPVFDWATGAEQTVGAIKGPVEALSLAARIVALIVLATAGVYGVHRRRVEFDLLGARGVSPLRLGFRAGVEAILPAAAGAAAGWALAVVAVRAIGPSPLLAAGVTGQALRQVALTAGAGLLLLGVAAGAAVRQRADTRPGRLRETASRVPWEGVVLALAAASFYEIVTRGGGPVGAANEAPKVDELLLLFPILFVAGAAGLVVRGLRRALPRLRAARAGSAPAYLAIRRLASAPRMALLLVTASSLAVGMLAYAGVLSTSIRSTADDKAWLSTGSDVALTLAGAASAVPSVPSTPVERVEDVTLGPGGPTADLIGIERSTFPQAAFWDSSVIGASMEDVMRALAPGRAERLPVVLVGRDLKTPTSVVVPGSPGLPVHVVMTLDAFPGIRPGRALVVVDLAGLQAALQGNTITAFPLHQLWAKGDPAAVLRSLAAARVPIELAATAEAAKRTPRFLALSWTFGYLEGLGVAAGLVALLGMILYLQARQRDREVSYALARRMGLSSSAHGVSVAGELAGMLMAAFVIGTGLAVLAASLV
jgi:putative ABC transport system permease protein